MPLNYAVLWFGSGDPVARAAAMTDAEVVHAVLLVIQERSPVALYECGLATNLKRVLLNGRRLSAKTTIEFQDAVWTFHGAAWRGDIVETGAMYRYIQLEDLTLFGRSFVKIRAAVGSRNYPYDCRGGVDYLLYFSADNSKRQLFSGQQRGCNTRSLNGGALSRIVTL